jgi:hypothetical protein
VDSPGTPAELQVSDDGLRLQAVSWEAAAGALASNGPTAGVIASWSASAAAVNAARAEIAAAGIRCTSRAQATTATLAAAATGYAENESNSAAQLRSQYRPTVC